MSVFQKRVQEKLAELLQEEEEPTCGLRYRANIVDDIVPGEERDDWLVEIAALAEFRYIRDREAELDEESEE